MASSNFHKSIHHQSFMVLVIITALAIIVHAVPIESTIHYKRQEGIVPLAELIIGAVSDLMVDLIGAMPDFAPLLPSRCNCLFI
jgi:hypothetical protein